MSAPGGRFFRRSMMVLVAVALFVCVRNVFSPPDWVDVTIHRVPSGVKHLYLIADGNSGAQGAVAPVPRISTESGPFSPGEWLESLPGSARGY